MRGFNYLLLVLVISLGATVLQAIKIPQRTPGSIEGFVRDEKGAPISGVSAQAFNILRGEASMASVLPNGFFRIVNLAGGKYSLWVDAKGYTSNEIPLVVVEDGQATRKDIQLRRELVLSKGLKHHK